MKKEVREYSENITRLSYNFLNVYAWYKGESEELKKWLGFGFEKTMFVSKDENITIHYEAKECRQWWDTITEKLTEELFDEICDNYLDLIKQVDNLQTNQEILDFLIKCTPAWAIFDEVSKYPEDLATPSMIMRLTRIRQTTEALPYQLAKRIKHEGWHKDYIFIDGKIIKKPLQEVINQENIIIK